MRSFIGRDILSLRDFERDVYVFVSYSIELSKGMELAPFYNFDSQVPDKAKDMLIKARMDILNGKLKVPYKLK